MSSRVLRLACREILHRRVNFCLGTLAVALATLLVVGGWVLLSAYARNVETVVAQKESEVRARSAELTDAMRRITKRMGFNVVILPRGQNLDDPFAEDYASKFMPEEYADRLGQSEIVTVNHLLPTLEKRVEWPERDGRVLFVVGVKGQVPLAHRDPRKPIMAPVPAGKIVVGSVLAREEKLETGATLDLLGRSFEVLRVNPRRGDKRDRTAWIELAVAQELFDKKGKINAIWALECSCALADVGKVRAELTRILPDVEVQEQGEKALARAEARQKAVEIAKGSLEDEQAARARLEGLGARFQRLVTPLVIACAGIWLALLAWSNVRERREEIGLLNALGVRRWRIGALFLLRAVFVGLCGAVPGALLGFAVGAWMYGLTAEASATIGWSQVFDARVFLVAVIVAPLLSALSCWLPALAATQQDPAVVLRTQ
jgi:putative ABC transport system permease protein